MVSKRKKKYTSGEGSHYMSRKQALNKLQLTLNDFRRLCILKGIYPREPRNRKKAQRGAGGIKTLYHVKDIQFLLHEPIIWKLRELKVFNRRVGRAKATKDYATLKRKLDNHPTLKLDHIVKERYPTFIDALRDLDDCLTLCFLFSTFPSLPHLPRYQSELCRRLTTEFMHIVIEAKALRKVFVSIKGYYFQAELKGQTITWIVPHHFGFVPQRRTEVDFKVMSTFVEFYVIMLGFVNFRLFHSLNIHYPPKLNYSSSSMEKASSTEEDFVDERVAALNLPLTKTCIVNEEEDVELDTFSSEDNPEKMEELRKEAEDIKNLKSLFKGMKVFLNREVPREPLVFVLRCFGAEVSWDRTFFAGSTFLEDDETITHQIIDRPKMDKQYISRYYVQPQWVFDSINARKLLPVEKYFIGVMLPPHLSPFSDKERDQVYIPPEERALNDPTYAAALEKANRGSDDEASDEDQEDECEEGSENEEHSEPEIADGKEAIQKARKRKMAVTPGKVIKEDPLEKRAQEREEHKLREKMVKNKYRNLYKSMVSGRQERAKEIWLLRKKRRLHEEKATAENKQRKKQKVEAAMDA